MADGTFTQADEVWQSPRFRLLCLAAALVLAAHIGAGRTHHEAASTDSPAAAAAAAIDALRLVEDFGGPAPEFPDAEVLSALGRRLVVPLRLLRAHLSTRASVGEGGGLGAADGRLPPAVAAFLSPERCARW